MGITRRELIGAGAAATVAAAVPAPGHRRGAAALALRGRRRGRRRARGPRRRAPAARGRPLGRRARGRAIASAGGRSTHRIGGGEVVEVGGQWVGPTQDRLMALAREVGVGTFDTYIQGLGVLIYQGQRSTFDAGGPLGPIPPVPDGIPETAVALAELDRLAATVPVERPWDTPGRRAARPAARSRTSSPSGGTTPGARFLLELGFRSVFAAEPRADLAAVLARLHRRVPATRTRRDLRAPDQHHRRRAAVAVRGRLAEDLDRGRRAARRRVVILRAPVRRITRDGRRLDVVSDRGTWSARRRGRRRAAGARRAASTSSRAARPPRGQLLGGCPWAA